ncbi:MAG TPA: chemotaxis-specific protein-glutamate methyltransferase CheB [Methylococcaceae bacterium]|nr:chemotaxis-specific protein-glutamate methyltransferase CheB [Methylococcaceae bacterium]
MNLPIRVLVVDDSRVERELIAHVLGSDPDLRVVASAADGEEALEKIAGDKPDVITMDVHMPRSDGFETTRRIMETQPIPIVIVTGSSVRNEVSTAFRAVEAGALAVLAKPMGIGHPEYEVRARELIRTVKSIAEVKLVRRWPKRENAAPATPKEVTVPGSAAPLDLVAVGASTGGPLALQTLLANLPKGFPLPIVVVQHMAPGFTEGFAEWLAQSSGYPVRVTQNGETLRGGQAYVAPEGWQMAVKNGGYVALAGDAPDNGLRPSVAYLFRSVAAAYGPRAAGVLLTGMGKDGAEALKLMKDRGAVTFAQDEASSVVHGMPGEAIHLGAVDYVLPPEKIAAALAALTRARHESA